MKQVKYLMFTVSRGALLIPCVHGHDDKCFKWVVFIRSLFTVLITKSLHNCSDKHLVCLFVFFGNMCICNSKMLSDFLSGFFGCGYPYLQTVAQRQLCVGVGVQSHAIFLALLLVT